jgi:Fic family protein
MHNLIKWYDQDDQTHPLIKIAVFVYELLSIHPFQDGNGRLSRLMATLLLLKSGYQWIQYISFEHVIENRKQDYYRQLRTCQALRPGEIVNPWIVFFLDCLVSLSNSLLQKLQSIGTATQLSERETTILTIIRERPGIQSGEIAQRLGIPNPTVKRLLAKLSDLNLIRKSGIGRSTSYTI